MSSMFGSISTILGGLKGDQASKPYRQEQEGANQKALDAILSHAPTDPAQRQMYFEKMKVTGQLTPQMEAVIQQGKTSYSDQADPALHQAQLDALSSMQQVGRGGLNMQDRAALNEVQDSNSQRERGAREAALANMQGRGMGGSGMELAAHLNAGQGAAQRNSQQGLDVAGMAQQRALQGMMQSGNLAGNMQQQQFGQQNQVAGAQDAIARFNAANSQQVMQRNAQAANQAQASNLGNAQNVANQNTGIANNQIQANQAQANTYNQQAESHNQNLANAYNGYAQQRGAVGNEVAAKYGRIGQGIGEMMPSDEDAVKYAKLAAGGA